MLFQRSKPTGESPMERARALVRGAHDAADDALGSIVGTAVSSLCDSNAEVRRAALEVIGHAGLRGHETTRALHDAVLDRAQDQAPIVRAEVASALALLPRADRSARLETLRRLLEDEVPMVREEAAAALGDARDRDARDALARHLGDPAETVRFECAYALAMLEDPRGRAVLLDALDTPSRRTIACDLLARIGARDAMPRLRALASQRFIHWADRLHALGALHQLGDPGARTQILGCVRAFGRARREYALWMIGAAGVEEGFPLLEQLARKHGDRLQDAALRGLAVLRDSRAAIILRGIATDSAMPVELQIDSTRRLAELDTQDRRHALETLATSTTDPQVREAASEALRELLAAKEDHA